MKEVKLKNDYKKPQLQYYGTLASIIRGSTGGFPDGGAPGTGPDPNA